MIKKLVCLVLILCFVVSCLSGCAFLSFLGIANEILGEQGTETTDGSDNSQEPGYEVEYSFYLKAGEYGRYGRDLTYNKGTEFEEKLIAYYIPAGQYAITNAGKYPDQVNVCSDKTIYEDGVQYPKDAKAYLLNVNETKFITVDEGYHIEIMEPSYIYFEKVLQ